ncbi:MAG TPA: ABC transporter substrate-binding protein, partial [Chthonomonadales bacterium]|nr:ABC transporter substrate-binding protein [Chthonomonadales bacterium]
YPSDYVVCERAVERTDGHVTDASCIGTGPYSLVRYRRGVEVDLASYNGYWGGKPTMPAVQVPILIDPGTLYDNYRTGKVDMCLGPVPYDQYAQDKERHRYMDQYQVLHPAQVDYLVMLPSRQPAFRKAAVRKAFAMAIDRDAISRVAYKGEAPRADGMLPPQLPGAPPSPPAIPYDPAQARALLAQAGYPGGRGFPRLELITLQKTPYWQEACQMIRDNLRANLGVNTDLQDREAGEYWHDQANEDIAFCLTGWVADYPDPQDFLSTNLASYSSLDHVDYHSARFDSLCRRADEESDEAKRMALYGAADRQLMQDVAVLPIVYPPRISLIHKSISGWRANLCYFLPPNEVVKTAGAAGAG